MKQINDIFAGLDNRTERWWRYGTIHRSGVGTYDFEVHGERGNNVVCVYLAGILSHSIYGYRESILPIEGTRVMYMVPEPNSKFGIILGCLPQMSAGEYQTKTVNSFLDSYSSSAGVTAYTEPTGLDLASSKNGKVLTAIGDRLRDIFPGEFALSNEQGIVFALMKTMAGLKVSERAKLEAFVLDDMIRITSGIYQHLSSFGPFQIYNDHGKISVELMATSKQQEFYGDLNTAEYKDAVEEASYDRKEDKGTAFKLKDNREMFSRFQMFLGELGSFVHAILCSPEKDKDTETNEAKNHTGLCQLLIDDSGRYTVKAANGIMLMRCDSIPVPKKLKEPWDPSGNSEAPEEVNKEPFSYDPNSPWSRSLFLRDCAAYFDKLAYLPFDKRDKDWKVPEAESLDVPQDTYDKVDNRRADFKNNADSQAAISIENDGSIIMRDSWGSEIYMRGGKIILSAPDGIEIRSGMTTTILAGNDLVMKANHSVDMTATNNDVRIKGQNNVHLCAMDRSILLESRGTQEQGKKRSDFSEGHPSDENKPDISLDYNDPNKGEDSRYCGVIIHAPESQVHISSKQIELASSSRLIIRAIKDKVIDIYVRCTNFYSWCLDTFNVSCSKSVDDTQGSGLRISPKTSVVAGQNVTISSNQETSVLRQAGRQIVSFIDTRGDDSSRNSNIHDLAIRAVTYPIIAVDLIAIEKEDNIKFTYRTPFQYGTEVATNIKNIGRFEGRAETSEADYEFKVYQSPWQFLYRDSPSMSSWKEYWIDETSPWPGYDFYKTSSTKKCYYYLPWEVNTIKGGRPKAREDIVATPKALESTGMNDYKVVVRSTSTENNLLS